MNVWRFSCLSAPLSFFVISIYCWLLRAHRSCQVVRKYLRAALLSTRRCSRPFQVKLSTLENTFHQIQIFFTFIHKLFNNSANKLKYYPSNVPFDNYHMHLTAYTQVSYELRVSNDTLIGMHWQSMILCETILISLCGDSEPFWCWGRNLKEVLAKNPLFYLGHSLGLSYLPLLVRICYGRV